MADFDGSNSKKVIYSYDNEKGYREILQRMKQINIYDRIRLVFGAFRNASAIFLAPVSDDTDRQFWAEDESSDSEYRRINVSRRKRKHSVAHRNRRRRSVLVYSPSSSTGSTGMQPLVRKRRKKTHINYVESSNALKLRDAGCSIDPAINSKTELKFTATGDDLLKKIEDASPVGHNSKFDMPFLLNKSKEEPINDTSSSRKAIPLPHPSRISNRNVQRNRKSKLPLPTTFRHK